ncbi:alpha/beta fold hydrolase [Trichothermofontia sp.]
MAPLLVYLPGMDGMGTLFQAQIPHLQRWFTIRGLAIAPDLNLDWFTLAQRLATLIIQEQQFTPQRPIYLCGESFGGCLALQLAMQFPRLVDRLILVNPASSLSRQFWLHGSGWLAQILPPWLFDLSCLAFVELLVNQERVTPALYHTLLQTVRSLPQATVAGRLEQLRRFAPSANALQQVQPPTLILASGADRLLPSVAEARYLQRQLPQARSHYLPNSGHACLLEPDVQLHVILDQQDWLIPRVAATGLGPSGERTQEHGSCRGDSPGETRRERGVVVSA